MQLRSVYKDRATKDPHVAKHDDIFAKMASVLAKLRRHKDDPFIRLEGCPVSVAEQVLFLVFFSGAKNPFLDPVESVAFNKAYLQWRSVTTLRRLQGIPYQRAGAADRGDARPTVEAPSPTDAE